MSERSRELLELFEDAKEALQRDPGAKQLIIERVLTDEEQFLPIIKKFFERVKRDAEVESYLCFYLLIFSGC